MTDSFENFCQEETLSPERHAAATKIHLTKWQIQDMIWTLIDQIKESGKKYTKIVGIRNGGIPISTEIAYALGLPHESIKISFYEGEVPFEDYTGFIEDDNCLLVDDLIDNGKTIKKFFDKFGTVDTAVLLWNEHNSAKIKPTYYAKVKPTAWVVFPWE